jgi:hypothetical protein
VASAVWKARTTSSRLRAALVGLALVVAGIVGVAPAAAGQFTSPSATPIYAYDTSGPLAHETAGDSAATVTASPTRRRLPDGASARGIGLVVAAEGGLDVAGTTARLSAHVDQAVADYDSGAISMSARQARAAGRNPNLEQTYRGQVIDSAVKNAVRNDSDLSDLWMSRSGEFGLDFHDIGTGTWWDVTTPGQWLNHVDAYTDPFGAGIGLFTR